MLSAKIAAGVLAAVMLVFSAGCSNTLQDKPEQEPFLTFTDSLGNEVSLTEKPKRTAVLFSSFADIWVTAGGSVDITVGESVERGFADSSAVLVDAGAGKTINTEALISAEPDFVICSADIAAQVDVAKLLKSTDIPCALFRVECFGDYLEVLKTFTDITENPDAYEKFGTDVKERVDGILSEIPSNGEGRRILFIRSGSGASSAKAKTAQDHFAAGMLKELGAYNIADNAPVLLDGLSVEEIIREDPDIIFISTMGKEDAARQYMDSVLAGPAWQALSAVREDRAYYLPKEMFQFKPNAKWDEAYRYLADLMYFGD